MAQHAGVLIQQNMMEGSDKSQTSRSNMFYINTRVAFLMPDVSVYVTHYDFYFYLFFICLFFQLSWFYLPKAVTHSWPFKVKTVDAFKSPGQQSPGGEI